MFIIRHKKFFLGVLGLLVAVSIALVIIFGFRLSLDFTGGSLIELSYPDGRPEVMIIKDRLSNLPIEGYLLQSSGEDRYILKTRTLTENEHLVVVQAMSVDGQAKFQEERFTSVGPTIGGELRRKAFTAIVLVLSMIIVFVAWAFRKVSKPVNSWKYGLVAVLTLFHDIAIPAGVFALLGHFAGVEIDILFVTALLAILGYSVNDTIVVFDRIRENLIGNESKREKESFGDIVGKSITQTYARSINVSITVTLTLVALLVFGGASTWYFALTLLIGVVAGTYSSICLASPLLVALYDWQEKRVVNK